MTQNVTIQLDGRLSASQAQKILDGLALVAQAGKANNWVAVVRSAGGIIVIYDAQPLQRKGTGLPR